MLFSCALRLGEAEANTISSIYRKCMTNGGILFVYFKYILLFKLIGLKCLISGKNIIGSFLLSAQEFFNILSYDIINKSDKNFSVKFELIYFISI
jgi:hypothetical protein